MPTFLKVPADAIVFDCDSTLSKIEGVDELAVWNGVGDEVIALTSLAMSHTGLNEALYAKRLDLIQPRLAQMQQLGEAYIQAQTSGAQKLMHALQQLNKNIFIVSGGILNAIIPFAQHLQIPDENIFAVELFFDNQENYLDFDHHSPLTKYDGKRTIIQRLKRLYPNIVHVGDGMNDWDAYELVQRFVGFGGVAYREKIAELSDYYIKDDSLMAALPYILTKDEFNQI